MNVTAAQHREPTLVVGDLLDHKYRVDHLLGQGGMAAVWAGTNVRTGKRVALKVLLPSLAPMPEVHALFQSEALAASRIDHPSVVTVFDVLEHDGMPCIVMELLEGEPLGSLLRRKGPLSVNDACGLLLPAMRGVAAAHLRGVVHRDLQPQNLFVCIGPDHRVVTTKVLDFGISVIIERSRDTSLGPTVNDLMGTPNYMAPEQLVPGETIDERTDVYAFGVLFYETLTGQVPFSGAAGPPLYQRIRYAPVPPVGELRPDLPPGLARTIDAALAKDRAQRPADLPSMIAAIEDELGMAVPVVPTPEPGTSDPNGRRTMISRVAPPHAVSQRAPRPYAATKFMTTLRPFSRGPQRVRRSLTHPAARAAVLHRRSVRLRRRVVQRSLAWAGIGALLAMAGLSLLGDGASAENGRAQDRPPAMTGAASPHQPEDMLGGESRRAAPPPVRPEPETALFAGSLAETSLPVVAAHQTAAAQESRPSMNTSGRGEPPRAARATRPPVAEPEPDIPLWSEQRDDDARASALSVDDF